MKKLIWISLIAFTMISCSVKYVLDEQTISKYALDYKELEQIQFYNTQEIILTRYENQSSAKNTSGGTLRISSGREVEQVIIKTRTKGRVVKQLEGKQIAVSFEPDANKYLIFAPKDGGKIYYLVSEDLEGDRGRVQYDGKTFITDAFAYGCTLEFKLNRKSRVNRTARIAKGNKI